MPQFHALSDTELEVSLCDGMLSKLRSKTTGAEVVAEPSFQEMFLLNLRDSVTKENVTSYGEPGVQSRCQAPPGTHGRLPLAGAPCRFLGAQQSGDALEAKFLCTPEWEFTLRYTLDRGALAIGLSLRRLADGIPYVDEAGFRLPHLRFAGTPTADQRLAVFDMRNHTCELDAPLSAPPAVWPEFDRLPKFPHRMGAMDCDFHHEIDFLISRGNDRLFGWGHETGGRTLSYLYEKSEAGLRFAPCFWCFARPERGREFFCGEFLLRCFSAAESELAGRCDEFKRSRGWQAEAVNGAPAAGCIFQKHGFLADGGGGDAEIAELKQLHDLGITIVYLPPLAPPEAYLNDLAQPVAACWGGAAALRRYIDEAHRLGMRVIIDMVLHGLYRESSVVKRHPEFLRRDELGAPAAHFIGSILAETENEGVRQFYLECCRFLVCECGADGFRFDVSGFQLPGWHAGVVPGDTVASQTKLLKMLRRELEKIKPVVFLEEGMGVTGLRYISHGFIPILGFLKDPDEARLPEMLRRMRLLTRFRFLKDRPGVQTMIHLKIHDTALMRHFGRCIRGGDLALLRWMLLAEGVPFLTDTSERGVADEIRTLLSLRRALPELGTGTTRFDVGCDNPRVYAFLRTQGEETTLVAVNFSHDPQSAKLLLPRPFPRYEIVFASPGCDASAPLTFRLPENGAVAVKLGGVAKPPAPPRVEPMPRIDLLSKARFSFAWVHTGFPESSGSAAKFAGFDEGNVTDAAEIGPSDRDGRHRTSAVPEPWMLPEFDDGGWIDVFRPATRQPFRAVEFGERMRYFEDVLAWEQNMLWSRSSARRRDPARFRARFRLEEPPDSARLAVCSPAIYDFDFAVAHAGNIRQLSCACNPVSVVLNGVMLIADESRTPEEELPLPPGLLKRGENVLAFAARRGNGGHGGCCELRLAGGISVPLVFKTPPQEETPLPLPPVSPGAETLLRLPEGRKGGFGLLRCMIPHRSTVRLSAAGRVFPEIPGRSPVRVNAYSGAELPLLRSDEFFDRNELFQLELGNLRFRSLTPGTAAMVFERPDGMLISLLSESDEFRILPEMVNENGE